MDYYWRFYGGRTYDDDRQCQEVLEFDSDNSYGRVLLDALCSQDRDHDCEEKEVADLADFNDILIEMNKGFNDLHKKFDAKTDQIRSDFTAHRDPCMQRFAALEKRDAYENGAKAAGNKYTEQKRDWMKWIIRVALFGLVLDMVRKWWT